MTDTRHAVAPALEPLLVPIGDLTPHPDNARNGDVDAIAEALERYGQYAPIVVQQSSGFILKGNHVYAAAHSLGWTHIAATVLDLDDDTATRLLVWDNRASDLGLYDDPLLAELLGSLETLEGTGFADRDLDRLLKRIEADAARALDAAAGGDGDTGGLGENAVVSYVLVFDTLEQQNAWYRYLKYLRKNRPEETIAGRILGHVAETVPLEDVG